jgi:V/A-type H+-transporting ATPase subunit A
MAFDPYEISSSLRAVDPKAIEAMMDILRAVKKRMTLKTLAQKLGVSYDVLIGYWTGKNKPTLRFLSRLAELAGVPRIPVALVKAESQSTPFRVPKRLTKELAEWLGLFVAEGHLKGTHQGIFLYNTSEEILKRFEELTVTVFGLKAKLGQNSTQRTPYAVIRNTAARRFLHYLGIPKEDKTHSIRIPYSIRVAPEEYLAHFLAGYLAGDGGFHRYTVSFCTASKALYSDLSYLLVRLGVLFRTRTKNGSYLVEADGESAEHLFRKLAQNEVNRYSKLEPLCQYASMEISHFTGLDIVPIGRQLLSMLAVDYNDYFGDDLFRAEGIRLRNYTTLAETPSLTTLEKMGRVIMTHEDAACSANARKVISILKASEEIYYDRICKILVKEISIPVFDITVERTHNFVGGIMPSTFHNTVMLHQLAKWADADIILYVGCGERGNEMTEVLEDFPKLKDPKSGKSLMERTVLVANTSNMPVAAREASIYTGVTLAEYFRDQGCDVALMADSTSRWAEALREISGRLEEMPGEEGFPAYLGSRLAQFYERAGHVTVLGSPERTGSVTITGAVSPPGGDFSEPVTQSTLRITKVFWALDKDMASRRFFPAINYLQSYSLYKSELAEWYQKSLGADWPELTEEALSILQRDKELREIVQLVGPDALPERERAILEAARMVKEDYLMQSAVHPVDTYCPQPKSYWMLKMIMDFWQRMKQAVEAGVSLRRILALPVVGKIARMKVQPHDNAQEMLGNFKGIEEEIRDEFLSIETSQ